MVLKISKSDEIISRRVGTPMQIAAICLVSSQFDPSMIPKPSQELNM
jgi:hypothetical protein